jgi:hypothetical protein
MGSNEELAVTRIFKAQATTMNYGGWYGLLLPIKQLNLTLFNPGTHTESFLGTS